MGMGGKKRKTMEIDSLHVKKSPLSKSECPSCKVNFEELGESIWKHIENKHGVTRLEILCHACGAGFRSRSYLKVHFRSVHAHQITPYKCVFCRRGFNTLEEIQIHLDLYHEKGNYHQCQICGKNHSTLTKFHDCILTHVRRKQTKGVQRIKTRRSKKDSGTLNGEGELVSQLVSSDRDDPLPISNNKVDKIRIDGDEKMALPVWSSHIEIQGADTVTSYSQLNYELDGSNCNYISTSEGNFPVGWLLNANIP